MRLLFATLSPTALRRFPFNMSWRGFAFPLGVLALCTGILARTLYSLFYRVMVVLFSPSVCLPWPIIAAGTTRRDMDERDTSCASSEEGKAKKAG